MFAETVRGASALAVQFEAGRIKKVGFLAAELPVDRRARPVAEVAARADVESIDHLQHAAH